MKVAIIGAGIGGIGSAIRMRSLGYEVDVYEANSYPGGKLSQIEMNGFRFDAGPSLFTMPQYVDELFELMGENPRDHFQYQQLDEICRYFWDDGTRMTTYKDVDATARQFAQHLGEKETTIKKHLQDSAVKYQLTGRTFLEKSLHKASTWLTRDTLKALTKLHRLDLTSTMHKVNQRRFKNKKTVQLFDRYATYNGSNPYKTPGLLNIIPHFEYHFGAFFPQKGMYSITQSLVELAERHGVQFHLCQKVDEITYDEDGVNGIMVNDRHLPKDIVISNMDVYFTYKHLLGDWDKAEKIAEQERSSSAMIFYWGINKTFDALDVHNIFFSEDYEKEFSAMSEGDLSDDPTVYVHVSSKVNADDAPEGKENWFVMINTPYHDGQDWEKLRIRMKKRIIDKLSKILHVSIAELIEEESWLDPLLIQSKTQSFAGALYGTSSNDAFAAFLRHPNFNSKIDRLYFCGGSVHPGGGIPLSLLSSKIIYDIIRNNA